LDGIVAHSGDIDFDVPAVLDNLIAKRAMPITVAIGLSSGIVYSDRTANNPRFNRSAEFDALNGRLASFVLDELLPEVERHSTPSGQPIRLSRNPNDRMVGGGSTGGIAAFTLAWERPDAFRRVFTGIGTFVGMRGGDRYPVLVRKTEPKPIRIVMQDGSNDEWLDGPEMGDWWMGNQTMERALTFAGYQVEHAWGTGSHDPRHFIAYFPEAMQLLWRGWPAPIVAGQSGNTFLKSLLLTGESWRVVDGKYASAGPLAMDDSGAIFFGDGTAGGAYKLSADATIHEYSFTRERFSSMTFGPDGSAYLGDLQTARIIKRAGDGKLKTIASDIRATAMAMNHAGVLYVSDSGAANAQTGKVWMLKPDGKATLLDSGLRDPGALAFTPDGQWLAVAESNSHWGYSYRIREDGTVEDKQQFYWFHVPDSAEDSGVRGWVMDRDGRLYAATRMGVQVFDRNGRVRAILPGPGGELLGISFGGSEFDTLYITCADGKIYGRKIKARGVLPWAAPIDLPPGAAG
jgi:sugar lactone lactonase YvrE